MVKRMFRSLWVEMALIDPQLKIGQKPHCVNTSHQPSQCFVLFKQSNSSFPSPLSVPCSLLNMCISNVNKVIKTICITLKWYLNFHSWVNHWGKSVLFKHWCGNVGELFIVFTATATSISKKNILEVLYLSNDCVCCWKEPWPWKFKTVHPVCW